METMKELYSIIEASKILNISRRSIYNYAEKGKIKLVKVDRGLKLTESDLNFLKEYKKRFKGLYTINETAKLLGVSRWTVYYTEKHGKIKFTKIDGVNMVSKSEIKRAKDK